MHLIIIYQVGKGILLCVLARACVVHIKKIESTIFDIISKLNQHKINELIKVE